MPSSIFCTKPWTSFEISDHKGSVKPCCWSMLKCGNVNSSSVEEIWNSPSYIHIRKLMSEGQLDLICAQDCPYRVGEHTDIEYPQPQASVFRQNWTLQREEIRRHQTILNSRPSIMSVVPTVACNLRCAMCYLDHTDRVELPSNIKEILHSYYPFLQELWLVGGEPLIDRQCLQIIESMNPDEYPDLHLGLITNGARITNEVEQLLTARQISWVLVSVDAATDETYRRIRGGEFENVLVGIKRLKAIRERQRSNWNLKIGFTLMRSNLHELLHFVDLAESLGVNCQFSPIFGDEHGESFYDDPATVEHAKRLVSELEEYLVSKGRGRVRVARVRARLTVASAPIGSGLFVDGDDALEYDVWRARNTEQSSP